MIYKKTLGPTITITNPFAIGWILLLIGIIFGSIGAIMQWETIIFLRGSVTATGTVIRCDMRTTSDNHGEHTNLVPVVSFQTQADRQITFEVSESDSSCFAGETVTVRYHPATPQDARLDSNAWLIFVGFGSAFALLALFYFLRGIVRKVRGNKLKAGNVS